MGIILPDLLEAHQLTSPYPYRIANYKRDQECKGV